MRYWRQSKGRRTPGVADPYDLSIPLERFKERAKVGRRMAADFAMLERAAGHRDGLHPLPAGWGGLVRPRRGARDL